MEQSNNENNHSDKSIENNEKKITIIGQNNRYQMKKVMKEEKKTKIRIETEKWCNLDKIILSKLDHFSVSIRILFFFSSFITFFI